MQVTELIYVHSKLMIVDDRLVICGYVLYEEKTMTMTTFLIHFFTYSVQLT